jgi:uncharacterized protein YndB with AHSA1/START domain
MIDATLQKSIYIKASRPQVWEYLTKPEFIEKWFHTPKSELKQGEDFAMYGRDSGEKMIWGKVIDASPFDRLEYTFTIAPMGDAISTVVWTLQEVAGVTRLSLEHSGLPQRDATSGLTWALDHGCDKHIDDLRAQLIELTH